MSRFLSPATQALSPYVPGEQPQNRRYIKLNTNESPYPPSPGVQAVLDGFDAGELCLYPDPSALVFRQEIAEVHHLSPDRVFVGGGSDEVLAYAFMAFFSSGDPVVYPDISYGFYKVYAQLFGLDSHVIPLRQDFSLEVEDYKNTAAHIVLANPNAPTGLVLTPTQIEAILRVNPDRLLILDEAYIDFSIENTCKHLLEPFDNLLIVRTYSKSYGLAGMRLGCAFGHPDLIAGLERIKYSFNPYNLDRISLQAGIAAIRDQVYLKLTVAKVIGTRDETTEFLTSLGFHVLPSASNFVFAKHPAWSGHALYEALKAEGILVRQFESIPRIRDYLRISMGTPDDMAILFAVLKRILSKKP